MFVYSYLWENLAIFGRSKWGNISCAWEFTVKKFDGTKRR